MSMLKFIVKFQQMHGYFEIDADFDTENEGLEVNYFYKILTRHEYFLFTEVCLSLLQY